MDKSNGDGVETKNSFTLDVIGVAVSRPDEATSGLAKLLPVERQPLPIWQKPQILPSELAGQQSEASVLRQQSTPGDLRRGIFTSRRTGSRIPVIGWRPVALRASLLANTPRNTRITGENRPPTAISGQTGSINMAEPHKRTRGTRLPIRLQYNIWTYLPPFGR